MSINIAPSTTAIMSSCSQPSKCYIIHLLPLEMHLHVLTYLRAYDLSAVQLTCRFFHSRELIHAIVQHTAERVYPRELTEGYDTPIVSGENRHEDQLLTYETLRNMEMLVVARVLSRPEPPIGGRGFYVSKSWCRTALRWLEVQQEELSQNLLRQQQSGGNSKKKKQPKKLSKKQQRIRNRRLSDASPPWPNVNSDICCPHSNLCIVGNSKAARSRRKVLDKQAWKVLKKLYPDSTQLDSVKGECLQCAMEHEMAKKTETDLKEKATMERKRPLSDPLVRGFYTRSRGVPLHCLATSADDDQKQGSCPLVPGLYHVLPRAWCHKWRRYLKHGGDRPCAPDATALLCDAHRFPLIPPHLEAYLYGETSVLLASSTGSSTSDGSGVASLPSASSNVASMPVGMASNPPPAAAAADQDMIHSLRAAGLSPGEVASQRLAMMSLERNNNNNIRTVQQQQQPNPHRSASGSGQELDRENRVVVEILTEEEFTAVLQCFPKALQHSTFAFRFAVIEEESSRNFTITWSTPPCRECDASGRGCQSDLFVRNRARGWVKKSTAKSPKSPASLEY